MLKTVLFLSIIIKLAFGEEDIIDDDEISTVEINMVTLANLAPYVEIYNDEIQEEMKKTCKFIKKKKACVNGFSLKAPVGILTGRRFNDGHGECMWFKRSKNPVVQALGNQCLPPAEVKAYLMAMRPPVMEDEDEDDVDAIEMSEGLFDSLSENAPIDDDDVTEDMMKYCTQINKEKLCLKSTTKAPVGMFTGRRGNDGPGECMWFKKRNNPVVQALNNRCLAPMKVIKYKQSLRNPPMMEHELFAALGLRDENNELNYNALGMVIIMMVLIGFGAYYKLCKNKKKESILNGERRASQYQSV